MEKSVKEKKEASETTYEGLELAKEYVEKEGFGRTLKMMKTSIETAEKVLQFNPILSGGGALSAQAFLAYYAAPEPIKILI